MKRHVWWLLAATGLLLLVTGTAAASGRADPALPNDAQVLQEDAWGRTVSGVRFITPAGWSAETSGRRILMQVPADDARIAIVDVHAGTAEQAITAAWNAYRPAGAPALRNSRDRPLRNGWSSIHGYSYESAGDPDRILRAQLLHEGDTWMAVIIDMPATVMDRREPQVTRVLSSLRPKGHVPETLVGRKVQTLDAARIASLVQFVEDARVRLGIPGIGLGVVQDGEVKYAGGLGIRDIGSDRKVDASTRFLTASITKPLTSLMLAKLVDAGKLDWDAPVAQVLPSFKVGDPALTQRLRVRHMICACSGIPAQDMEGTFSGDQMDPDDVLGVLAGIQPTARIGELYQYSNLMAVAGGYLGGHVAHPGLPLDQAYDRAMQELVFDPLGMTATTFDWDAAMQGNFASPHATTIDGDTVVADMGINRMSIVMRPDGGAWSNVEDLTRYLQMELAGGLLADGGRYIGTAALQERLKGQVARGGVEQWYGMGLKTDRRLGILQVTHGGSMSGYQAEMTWLPENNAGYVLLTNADAGVELRNVLVDRFRELLFDLEPAAEAALAAMPPRIDAERKEHRATLTLPLAAETLRALAPVYAHPVLGTIRVVSDGSKTWFDAGGWRTQVASVASDDGLALESITPGLAGFRFKISTVDGARALVLDDGQRSYTFLEETPGVR
ncbi:MAG: serine hydrolase domain-containing protein [Thermomonas sp.]